MHQSLAGKYLALISWYLYSLRNKVRVPQIYLCKKFTGHQLPQLELDHENQLELVDSCTSLNI